MSIPEDKILTILMVDKNPDVAFKLILNQFKEPLYWYIRKNLHNHQDTDDVLQNTMVKVWKNLSSFKGDSKLSTWIYRIATNETINQVNKDKRHKAIDLDNNIFSLKADSYFDENAAQLKLKQAIETLPIKQRQVFILKCMEDKKYQEIAEITGSSIGGLKATYHHAVQKIKKFIQAD